MGWSGGGSLCDRQEKSCQWCGRMFETKHYLQRYCSAECLVEGLKARIAKRVKKEVAR